MSPITQDTIIEYPKYLEEGPNELKLEYAEKMRRLWFEEREKIKLIICLQGGTITEESDEEDNVYFDTDGRIAYRWLI